MNLVLFILACYGMTDILVNGLIFDKIRPKYKFFHCPQCVGFWTGILIFLAFWFSGIKLFPNIYFGTFLFACLSSGASNFLCSIYSDEGIKLQKTFN